MWEPYGVSRRLKWRARASAALCPTTAVWDMNTLGRPVCESSQLQVDLPQSQVLTNLLYEGGGIHLNSSLNEVSSVTLMTCSVEWLQPCLLGSNEKISWYLARRDWAEATSLGGHDSNPLRSYFSNNFSCLCFMVNLGI